jgi:hypothetical protein
VQRDGRRGSQRAASRRPAQTAGSDPGGLRPPAYPVGASDPELRSVAPALSGRGGAPSQTQYRRGPAVSRACRPVPDIDACGSDTHDGRVSVSVARINPRRPPPAADRPPTGDRAADRAGDEQRADCAGSGIDAWHGRQPRRPHPPTARRTESRPGGRLDHRGTCRQVRQAPPNKQPQPWSSVAPCRATDGQTDGTDRAAG